MRVFLSALFLAAATLVPLAEAQTPDDSNEGSRLEWDAANSIWRFKWWGRQGRTYFIQHSDNLQTWLWLPLVEPGNHAVREWGFTSTGSKFFLRLVYTDQPSSDPENDDFDGDGVSNLAEVMQGTSPLRTADSDGDGLPNDWEIATGLDPQSGSGSNGATGDVDQDGLTNEEEAALATNPQVADTDGDGLSDSQDAVPTNAIMKVNAAPEVSYAIVDLGASSDVGSVLGINDRGEVLFSKYVNNPSPGKVVAKLWSSGNFYELPEESNRVVALLQDGSVYFVTKSVTESTIAGGSTSERRRKIWKRGSPVSDGGPGYFYISKFENDSENRVMPPSSLPGIPEVLQSKVVEAFAEAREALSDGGWTLGPVGDGNLDLWYDTQWVNDAHRVGMSALLVCMERGQGYSPGRESTISAQVYGDDAHAFSGGVTWQGDYYETLTFSTTLYVAGASANRVNNFRRYSDGSYTYTLQTDSSKQTFINGAEASGCSTLVDAAVTASAEGPYYIGDDGKGEAGLWCDNGGNPAHIKLKGMPAFAGSHGAIERRITRNLVTLGGSMIWRNGRTRSLADLTGMTGENPVWTNLSASLISPENNLIAGTASREGASHSVLLVPVDMAVDANRDGVIKFAGNYSDSAVAGKPQDKTESSKPFRFWINDDDDGNSNSDGEQVGSNRKDYADGIIKNVRDLEDFTRLQIYIGGLQEAIASGNIKVGLKWKNATGPVAIKVYTSADAGGSDEYLRDEESAVAQTQGDYGFNQGEVKNGGEEFIFPADVWTGLSDTNPKKCFIFEGSGEGKGELVITFHKSDGTPMGEGGSVWLDLVNVRKMYERAKATPDNISNPHESTTTPSAPSVSYVLDPFNNQWDYPPVSWTEVKDYIIFVHGWNTPYNDARTFFAESMFKRLWQRGYKGRFAALYWPTLVGPNTYNESEYRGWFFGESLKQYAASLPDGYTKHLVAHSMGNIVAGSALLKGMSVSNYAMIDAAVPASCFDPNTALQQSSYGNSPDNDTDSPTQALAYKNRLASVSPTLINFYLTSDDALGLWALNNTLYKPEVFYTIGGGDHAYKYYPGNPSGQKLFLTFLLSANRNLTQVEESLGYAARSSTKAVGAEGNTRGPISESNSIDLSTFGYEHEHSGFWKFSLQAMKPAYDTLMDKLRVQRNEE